MALLCLLFLLLLLLALPSRHCLACPLGPQRRGSPPLAQTLRS
jgi:hypothetical protein